MINKLWVIILMAFSIFSLTSCLGSDDENIIFYDDTAITSFTLGTLNRQLTTTASTGLDSTYTTTYNGDSTVFYINQIDHTIYNPDSLPVGVDATKVVCTIGTKNNGIVVLVLKNQSGEDSLAYYSSSDSLDFTNPLTARVYNNGGTEYTTYTIHVNVHQQTGNEINWNYTSNTDLSSVGDRRLVSIGDEVYLFGVKGSSTVGYKLDGSSWTALSFDTDLDADAYKSVIIKDSCFYTLSGGTVYRSTDGETWEAQGTSSILTQIVGASPLHLYALGTEGIYYSSDNGATWTLDSLDDETSLLPDASTSFVCKKHLVNDDTYKLLLIGSCDGESVIWSKVDQDDDAEAQPWSYYTVDRNYRILPDWNYLQAIAYNGGLLALGGDFSTFYISMDEGLVWTSDSNYDLPSGFDTTEEAAFGMTTTESHVIYISKAYDSNVWYGQLARTAWATEETSFVE